MTQDVRIDNGSALCLWKRTPIDRLGAIPQKEKTLQPPNILIVTTDQQRTDSLSGYGSAFTATPHLDRLATEGARLDRAYCTNPVCTPSRVSLFTGKQVGRHGVWNVGVFCPDDERMLSHLLAAAGYRTHYVGKAHFQPFGAAEAGSRECRATWNGDWHGPYYGFETVELALGHGMHGIGGHCGDWVRSEVGDAQAVAWQRAENLSEVAFGGNAFDWPIPLRYHQTVWTADRTIAFLEAHDPSKPFLLAVGFQDPHHPHAVPTAFTERVDPDAVPPPDYDEGELDDKPPHFLAAREGRLEASDARGEYPIAGQWKGADFRRVSEQDARLGRAYYHTMVRLIDREFGRVLEALDRLGLAENTLIVFTSDHGELLGDHGLWMKGPFHYEPLIRVPVLIRWPVGFDGGKTISSLFSLADVVPTCLDAVGLPCPEDVDGRSALPMLRGETPAIRDDVLIEMVDDPTTLRLKTIVTGTRKLTWYAERPYGELYDLDRDPREKVNRWDDPAYATDKARLLDRLLDYGEAIERRYARHSYA